MESFTESVNKFLAFNEYQILEGYGTIRRKQAEDKVAAEYEKFNKQQRIESDFDREVKKLLQKKVQINDRLQNHCRIKKLYRSE